MSDGNILVPQVDDVREEGVLVLGVDAAVLLQLQMVDQLGIATSW